MEAMQKEIQAMIPHRKRLDLITRRWDYSLSVKVSYFWKIQSLCLCLQRAAGPVQGQGFEPGETAPADPQGVGPVGEHGGGRRGPGA
jgi:hypothetical protein